MTHNEKIRVSARCVAASLALLSFALLPASARAQGATEHFGETGFPNPEPGYDQNDSREWLAEPGDDTSRTCDGDFMNTIFNRAYLNAQQDILLNQLIIRKPDSVLEYTCFDQFLGFTAYRAAPIFSETQTMASLSFDVGTVRGPRVITSGFARPVGSMRGILEPVVYDVVVDYLENNFWHTFLGGTTPAGAGGGVTTFPATARYVCDAMARAWEYAKCYNFADSFYPEVSDRTFYEFEHLIDLDPRIYPDPMDCDDPQITQESIDAARNVEFTFARFQTPEAPGDRSYTEMIAPGECEDSVPIPTGLTVNRTRPILEGELVIGNEPYSGGEFVCSNPRCHYDGAGACVP